ncbi:MAG: UDP-3-O-(3-hydroxymyristoyl)glucosamine N-acyltransferase [Candidatus Hydrogenedentes bacterium]|nr:UDP-3-O-(3-hydroxymyristoyl)glucosamine N-acyltransferase [Candidatus Hydrogenedentota bacterium]
MKSTVGEIADLVGGTVIGDRTVPITGLNGIREAGAGELTFLADPRYTGFLKTTQAAAVIVYAGVTEGGKTLIQVPDPYQAVGVLLHWIQQATVRHPRGIHPTAVIGEDVRLGEGVALGAHVCLEDGCVLGDRTVVYAGAYVGTGAALGADCLIYPNVTICDSVRIGDRCIIHPGAVIGADGFGFAVVGGRQTKIPQVGTVVIGDDVEIGANTTVDRATFGETTIGEGTKIDNIVQIGHNTRVGEQTIICGKAGVSGSTIIGDRVTIAGGVGLAGHLEVGDGASIGAYSGVSKSIKPGQKVFGYPAVEHTRAKRMYAALRQLPDTLRYIRVLERRIAKLEGKPNAEAEDDS